MVPSIHTSHERQARRDTYPTIISWPRCPLPPRPSPLTHSPTTHRLLLRKHSRRRGARQSGPENSKSCWAQGGGAGKGGGGAAVIASGTRMSKRRQEIQLGAEKRARHSAGGDTAHEAAQLETRRPRRRGGKRRQHPARGERWPCDVGAVAQTGGAQHWPQG